jgi:hypothetical protein
MRRRPRGQAVLLRHCSPDSVCSEPIRTRGERRLLRGRLRLRQLTRPYVSLIFSDVSTCMTFPSCSTSTTVP